MSHRFSRRTFAASLVVLPAAALAGEPEKPKADTKAEEKGWTLLFDGKSLGGWKKTEFAGAGDVKLDPAFRGEGPAIVVSAGASLSGVTWTKSAPKTNYEVALECMKIDGDDFMLGLTFPVGESHATLVLGGWGGPVTGISNIDNSDASENPTTKYVDYAKNRWYRVRLRVTPGKLEAWLDDKAIVDQDITGRKISLRPGSMHLATPVGLSTYQTTAAYRAIRIRIIK